MNLLFIKLMFIAFCFIFGLFMIINIIFDLIIKYFDKKNRRY